MPRGTITAIALQSGDQNRVNVFVDGEFAIGIDLATLQSQGLYRGQVLTDEDWLQLERAATGHRAWEAALRLLEARPRSEHEIRDRLRRKQFEPEHIDAAVRRLYELELLDDAQFARLWISNRAATRPKGSVALRRELLSKGVAREVAAEAVAVGLDADAEAAACEEVARQALRRFESVSDWATFQRKLGGLLQRRGFTWDTVGPLLRRLWQERAVPADELDEEDAA